MHEAVSDPFIINLANFAFVKIEPCQKLDTYVGWYHKLSTSLLETHGIIFNVSITVLLNY